VRVDVHLLCRVPISGDRDPRGLALDGTPFCLAISSHAEIEKADASGREGSRLLVRGSSHHTNSLLILGM